MHCFFICTKNRDAAAAMMRCTTVYDEKILTLEVKADEVYMMATMAIITTGLETIWAKKQNMKSTTLYMLKAEGQVIRELGNQEILCKILYQISSSTFLIRMIINKMIRKKRKKMLNLCSTLSLLYFEMHFQYILETIFLSAEVL